MGIIELADDDILHVADNKVTAAFFSTTVEAMHGQRASTIGVPPETLRRWLQAYRESERTGLPVQFDYTHETPEGPCWLAVTVCCIGTAASGRTRCSYVALDVTAQKVVEQELRRSQQQLEAANVQLSQLARTDALTGLRNRGAFNERLIKEVTRVTRYHTPLSLLLIDIDHFKAYNDTYGHVAGDEVLRTIGRLFEEQARQSDQVARYGGEEFAIILPNTDEAESVLAAERIRRSVDRAPWPERRITISIGAATYHAPWTAEQLVELTDRALYSAKDLGRNLVVHASHLPLESASHRTAEALE
jgi:diguanylate cyclase (GGDEF)-like protein